LNRIRAESGHHPPFILERFIPDNYFDAVSGRGAGKISSLALASRMHL